MKLFALVILGCVVADAQSVPRPRELTIEEAHSILTAWIPDATQRLPGYELDDFTINDPPWFYFIEVIWDNPRGSVVWGNYAVDRATGDLWTAVICERITSRRVRAAQRQVWKELGLTKAEYRKIKRPGPMCE
jgi:hypothetical protein